VKIPTDIAERWAFYEQLVQNCIATRGDRRRLYQTMRNFYMYGSDGSSQSIARYNKIYPHLDKLTSFLYSQETTRFATSLGVSVSDLEMKKVGPINRGINDEWTNSNTDIVYGLALLWSLVYGSTFVKTIWDGKNVRPHVIDPHNFSVLREDSPMLSSQEAVVHSYYNTRSQLETEIAGHPRRKQIMDSIVAGPKSMTAAISPLDRIVTSASQPNVVGNLDFDLAVVGRYMPKVQEPMIEMQELYVWEDETNDYRIVTLADPFVCIYDRSLGDKGNNGKSIFIKGELPFVQVCPLPAYDYFYGYIEVERLAPIQELLNDRWEELRHMMSLQAHPPKSFSGFQGITDEIALAFDSPDGQVQSDMPGAKVDSMAPAIPADLFTDVDRLNDMFDDTSGINNVMEGKGEHGVRSSGHASQLARLGSSRVKKRAMIIEDSLEKLATLMLQIKQVYDDREYREDKGEDGKPGNVFIASQFTKDFVVKVDGHSNSPIFVEDQTQIAFELYKAKVISGTRLLELITVPMREQLIHDLQTQIEPAQAAAHQEEMQLERDKVVAKLSPRQQAKKG
jgi:hypothetical protein